MELNEINTLIGRYFDGKTTLDEERTIATYLATTESLPKEHIALKAMFEAMGLLREIKAPNRTYTPRKRSVNIRHIRRVAAVAACLVVGVIVATHTVKTTPTYTEPGIICYVNGTMVDDPKAAEMEAHRILGNMNQNINLAMAKIDKVNLLKTK